MSPLLTNLCWGLGAVFTALVLYKLLSLHEGTWFRRQPPAVRVNPALLREMQEEVIHNAMKRPHVIRGGFQKVGTGK